MNRLPSSIILEVTNKCNLSCVMCHFHGQGVQKGREKGNMSRQLWQKVLAELAASDQDHTVITHGVGEPLLYEGLFELLESAKAIPNITVGFMTNGMLLTPDISTRLVELQVDWLAFSVDGVEPDPHARYRRNSDLHTIERHIDFLIGEKKRVNSFKPELSFNMVGLPEIVNQQDHYVERWLPHSRSVMISHFRPVGSKRLEMTGDIIGQRWPCPKIYEQMVVSWDGKAALCCEDIFCEVEIGDLYRQDIAEIWHGNKIKEIRRQHEMGNYGDIAICLDCDVWAAEKKIEGSVDEQRRVEMIKTPAYVMYKHL